MSSEAPLDLSPEAQIVRSKKKKLLAASLINGAKNKVQGDDTAINLDLKERTPDGSKVSSKASKKKRKLSEAEAGPSNPLQRGKYGLRMLPQQVDYYQSVLEDRRIKMFRQSTKQVDKSSDLDDQDKVKLRNSPKKKDEHIRYDFNIGEVIWATLPNYKTWFPALVVSNLHCKQKPPKKGHIWVYWFGDHQVSEIPKTKIRPFFENFKELSKGNSSSSSLRMKEALQVLVARANISFPPEELVASSSSNSSSESYDRALIAWAENGFPLKSDNSKTAFAPDPLNPIPSTVSCYLPLDTAFQEALKSDDRLQQIIYYDVDKNENDDILGAPEYKQSQVERVRKGEVSLNQICLACCCDAESAKHSTALLEHPLFEGGLCRLCFDNIQLTMYAPGPDNKNSFCTICGQLGKLAICENDNCHRVFCLACIQLYVGPGTHLKVLEIDGWECYLCKSNNNQTGLLKTKKNWRSNIQKLYDPVSCTLLKAPLVTAGRDNKKKPIRVLSLFDGLAETKFALSKLGLQIEAYYASENDKDASALTKKYFGDDIKQIDQVEQISLEKILEIAPIDLLVGHYPCNEISLTSPIRKGFFEPKGPGHYFLYFNHILNLVRIANKSHHIFFLFELFSYLNDSQRDIISNFLMCKPVTLNANNFFDENRCRYVWSNIPGINRPLPQETQENIFSLSKLLVDVDVFKTENDSIVTRIEKSFGFDENYTGSTDLNKIKRQNLLKKVWPIPLLSHFLWPLTDFVPTLS